MTRNTWELKLNSTILTHSKKQVDVYCIDLDSEFVDLNYIVASLIFCHFWRSIVTFSENIVVVETGYQMLKVLSF